MQEPSPQAEVLTIGTELLLGEIVDTNTAAVARYLRSIGLNLFRTSTVGDNPERIAQAAREALARSQAVLTTGGLGPTVDDPTRQAIALAFHVPLEFHPELWQQIQERFERYGRTPTENNRRQAYLPRGAVALTNPVGDRAGVLSRDTGRMPGRPPGCPPGDDDPHGAARPAVSAATLASAGHHRLAAGPHLWSRRFWIR